MHVAESVFLRSPLSILALSFLPAACASGGLESERVDASASVDAWSGVPDARPGMPDARPGLPDARPGAPDAHPHPDAYVPPDAHPPPDAYVPPDGPCSMGWVQLLANPGFESGHNGWSESPADSVIASEGGGLPFDAQAGSWAAVVNAYGGPETLSQSLHVPPSATQLRLRGFKCYVTAETSSSAVDKLDIELRDGATTLDSLESTSNLSVGTVCGWTAFEYNASNAFAGMTIQLVIYGEANGSYWTSYALDTLSLEAYACQ